MPRPPASAVNKGMGVRTSLVVLNLMLGASLAFAGDPQSLRLPVTRDTWFSDVGRESECNLGGAGQMKLKSIQEMSLVDLDPQPLRGRVVRSATLHLRKRGSDALHRVTVGSFAADWVEGTAASYEKQPGSSCFDWAKYPNVPWAYPGSDLTAVMLGQGGTVWNSAEATPPDAEGWMRVPVDPAVIAARVAGVSKGFLLFDDTGTEWTRQGEKFTLHNFPNRFIYSRDSGRRNAPYFTIELGPRDGLPPEAPTEVRSETTDLPGGEAFVSWRTPIDRGPAGVAGFVVQVNGKPAPQYLVPRPLAAGKRVVMHLRDLNLAPGASVEVQVRAVDGAGNVGPAAHARVTTSAERLQPLPGKDPQPFADAGPLPTIGGAEVAIVDALDKLQPDSGRMIPPQAPEYLAANHLWSAAQKRIRLAAARNEFVSFQILLRHVEHPIEAAASFPGSNLKAIFYEYRNVETKAGQVPDPLIPSHNAISQATPAGSLLCEIYVPHQIASGNHSGTLTLRSGSESLTLAIDLNVWNFALPDQLSFIPELNCYGLPDNERDYYRLAHENRTVIDRVPYSQTGIVADGCAPRWNGQALDWSAWDKRFGPLLDGSAFSDLPRKGVPLDVFYLPLNENWPSSMAANYNGSYWADQAFPPSYRRTFVEVSRLFAEHFNQKGWSRTKFLCFFNGKNNFKQRGWSHGSSPWLLDEPANFQDYWALHWFGQAFHAGVDPVRGPAQMLFRCDISRPQWQRDLMDDVLNYNVVGGGAFLQYRRMVLDRKRRFHQVVIPYGTTNDPADSNMQPVGWSLDNWTLGADGVLPWQVIGNNDSWKHGEATCLFYPGGPVGSKQPIPSIRLKAYLRGEQDVDYLVLLARLEHQSQRQIGQRVRDLMKFDARRKGTGAAGEDAGVIEFANLKPQDAWRLRERVGAVLSAASMTRGDHSNDK